MTGTALRRVGFPRLGNDPTTTTVLAAAATRPCLPGARLAGKMNGPKLGEFAPAASGAQPSGRPGGAHRPRPSRTCGSASGARPRYQGPQLRPGRGPDVNETTPRAKLPSRCLWVRRGQQGVVGADEEAGQFAPWSAGSPPDPLRKGELPRLWPDLRVVGPDAKPPLPPMCKQGGIGASRSATNEKMRAGLGERQCVPPCGALSASM